MDTLWNGCIGEDWNRLGEGWMMFGSYLDDHIWMMFG
jgi:hypothetical protein